VDIEDDEMVICSKMGIHSSEMSASRLRVKTWKAEYSRFTRTA